MRRICFFVLTLTVAMSFCGMQTSAATMFSDDDWTEQRTLLMGKWSQLFYEVNVGINVSPRTYKTSADFIYFSLGYGKPNTSNAWRYFLPDSKQQAPDSQEEHQQMVDDSTNGLHAATVGIGWQHFFTHWIGFHMQAGYGTILDLGGGNASTTSSSSSSSQETDTKSTFIYHSAPVQAGLDFCFWNQLEVQVGATYMWKEIPIITLGLGITF